MEKVADRLKDLIDELELSPSSFADEIRVQRSGISHILAGRNKPSLEFIEKLIRRYPKTDLHWLISGRSSQVNLNEDPNSNLSFKIGSGEDSEVESHSKGSKTTKTVKVLLLKDNGKFEEFVSEEED